MRPSQIARLERSERLANFKRRMDENPKISLDELGKPYGISRERVRQILKENHIDKTHARHPSNGICANGHNKYLHKNSFYSSMKYDHNLKRRDQVEMRCFYCNPLSWHKTIDSFGRIRARVIELACTYCGTLFNKNISATSFGRMESGDNRYKGHDFCSKSHFYSWNNEVNQWYRYSPIYQRMLARRSNGEHFTVSSIIDEYQQAMHPSTFQRFKTLLNNIKSPFMAGLL